MDDTRIEIITAKAILYCDNCSSNQTHTLTVYYNDTTDKLEVDRECVCYNGVAKYKEVKTSPAWSTT